VPSYKATITGAGVVCPSGHTFYDLSRSVVGETSHVDWVTRFEPPEDGPVVACEVDDYDLSTVLESRKSRLDPAQSHFMAACRYALDAAGAPQAHIDADAIGIAYGTSFGPTCSVEEYSERLAEKGARYANPIGFTNAYINAAPSLAAIEWSMRGPNHTVCAGWVSGMAALEAAMLSIATGAARAMLAGGSEALSEMLYRGLAEAGYVSMAESPEAVGSHEGLVPGEGGGALFLEAPEEAARRGAEGMGTLSAAVTRVATDPSAAYERAICEALGGTTPDLYLSPANGYAPLVAAEREALERLGLATALPWQVRLADTVGELFGAAAPVAVGLALHLLQPGESALVGALGPLHAGAALVQRGGAI
jgi:3-oxoacyl-(acyl-carrier-protein) synthase